MRDYFFILLQYVMPQHILSRLMGFLADIRTPWFKNSFIRLFIKRFPVDMQEAIIEGPTAYPSFNQFFIRKLKPELRPITEELLAIASPADGTIAQLGEIKGDCLFQAKNHYFNLEELLGGDKSGAKLFENGSYATIYLAPHNYHRVHMPLAGKLTRSLFVPGKLFSVNKLTSERIPHLYSRNERLITLFETDEGMMAVILVGAMIVGSMQTVWMDKPVAGHTVSKEAVPSLHLAKGDELGHFKMGSTVIILFEKNKATWLANSGAKVKYGQKLGFILGND